MDFALLINLPQPWPPCKREKDFCHWSFVVPSFEVAPCKYFSFLLDVTDRSYILFTIPATCPTIYGRTELGRAFLFSCDHPAASIPRPVAYIWFCHPMALSIRNPPQLEPGACRWPERSGALSLLPVAGRTACIGLPMGFSSIRPWPVDHYHNLLWSSSVVVIAYSCHKVVTVVLSRY